jgi:DNA-binding MarR family transcriptional regulator
MAAGRPGARAAAAESEPGEIAIERYVTIAEFRSHLRTFLQHNERACRRRGLTPQRYQLLLAIKGAPDRSERLSFTEIAETLQLSRNTVTELCARAEDAGLLRRERSETDLRVVYLRVTPEGERRLSGVIRDTDGDRAELVSAFTELTEAFRVAARRPRARRRK